MRVYLAGPDVFLPDAMAVGERKKALCRARGVEGLFPLDGGADPQDPAAIFAACMALLRVADAGLFNLTPFRGIGADPGTAFEMGALCALGRPVVGYTGETRALADRVAGAFGPLGQGATGPVDRDGLAVEDFGAADNLMLTGAGPVIAAPASEAPALAAFEAFARALDALIAEAGAAGG